MNTYRYKIFDPSGNVTALVMELVYDPGDRRRIQDAILERHKDVEQVGFISEDADLPELWMTGAEFCGNATRAAAWHYMGGLPGEMKIRVAGVDGELGVGIDDSLDVWAQMPVLRDKWNMQRIGEGMRLVEMEGIAHLVVAQRQSAKYLKKFDADSEMCKEKLKASARELLERHELFDRDACGVVFCENVLDLLKIHPCVFINSAGTAYYEMACGSGSVAVAVAAAFLRGKSVNLPLLQPSMKIIEASVELRGGVISEATIRGRISETGGVFELEA
ncbi:MAG: hypothetical protein FWE20_07620 [Defluviitaleaceae bacterium]|nr:hypothetical protein [Defluviitaleaceae bacterium]